MDSRSEFRDFSLNVKAQMDRSRDTFRHWSAWLGLLACGLCCAAGCDFGQIFGHSFLGAAIGGGIGGGIFRVVVRYGSPVP
jgi:hypothetical protein